MSETIEIIFMTIILVAVGCAIGLLSDVDIATPAELYAEFK